MTTTRVPTLSAPTRPTLRPNTLDDNWLPEPGTYVWQQMYSPQQPRPDSTLTERLAHGCNYQRRKLMRVLAVTPTEHGLHQFLTIEVPYRYTEATIQAQIRNGMRLLDWLHGMSLTESDWAILEAADPQVEAGVLV